ncbi:MAG TPA: hypothetical protein VNP98_16495 [Chthoniobacterales bacterium]|nr:hypothetical protein [Chthoniobacterales bacterium]
MTNEEQNMVSTQISERDILLPTQRIAYPFAVGLHLAQHVELNLREIIYILDYHGWIEELPPREKQPSRFKNADEFIDTATLGALSTALEKSGVIKTVSARKKNGWKAILQKACKHRNELAHRYLAKQDFENLTKTKEDHIVHELNFKAVQLSYALKLTENILAQLRTRSDEANERMNQLLELPANADGVTRKYIPKHLRKRV